MKNMFCKILSSGAIICASLFIVVCMVLAKKYDIGHAVEDTNIVNDAENDGDIAEEKKLYMLEDATDGDNGLETVFIDEMFESIGSGDLPEYDFECDLWKENSDTLFQENATKIEKRINTDSKDTVRISAKDYEFLSSFLNHVFSAYID